MLRLPLPLIEPDVRITRIRLSDQVQPQGLRRFASTRRYAVQRLQTLCPRLGKVKIAQVLARAGLHLGATTIGRMRRQQPAPAPTQPIQTMPSVRRVTARYPNHLWHVDLTTLPTAAGKLVGQDTGAQQPDAFLEAFGKAVGTR